MNGEGQSSVLKFRAMLRQAGVYLARRGAGHSSTAGQHQRASYQRAACQSATYHSTACQRVSVQRAAYSGQCSVVQTLSRDGGQKDRDSSLQWFVQEGQVRERTRLENRLHKLLFTLAIPTASLGHLISAV